MLDQDPQTPGEFRKNSLLDQKAWNKEKKKYWCVNCSKVLVRNSQFYNCSIRGHLLLSETYVASLIKIHAKRWLDESVRWAIVLKNIQERDIELK